MKKIALIGILSICSFFAVADEYCPATITCKNQNCSAPDQYIFTNIWFNSPIKDGIYFFDQAITVVANKNSSCSYKGNPDKGNPDSLLIWASSPIMPDFKADQSLWQPIAGSNDACFPYGGANGNNRACPFLNPFKK